MDLKIVSDDQDVLRLAITGRILREEGKQDLKPIEDLLGSGGYCRNVLLSMAEVSFLDSRCLSWLVAVHKRFCEAGGKLVFHSIRPTVMEILELVRFDVILRIGEDETAALEMLKARD